MIIKITIKDNDFEPLLAGFCQNLSHGYPVPMPTADAGNDAIFEYIKADKRWNELYHMTDQPDQAEKEWFCQSITQAWQCHVKNHQDADYLTKSFECAFVGSITGEWENGETFYFFPWAYGKKYICL